MSAFEKARGTTKESETENKIYEEMERAVMMEREKILKETDDRLARIENAGRDSYLAGRGFSIKLNIDAIGKQKSDKITE